MRKKYVIIIVLLYSILALSLSALGGQDSGGEETENLNATGLQELESSPVSKKESGMEDEFRLSPEIYNEYREAINRTASMVYNDNARSLASRYGLDILNVTWEDTGRYHGSSVGPNISDMTIQVALQDPRNPDYSEVTCMPVIRFPNFEDLSTDLDPRDFTLLTGNQHGGELKRISLYQFLETPREYLSNPGSWKGFGKTFLADRDTKVLVSAQACFLPIPEGGKAVFNPVLFNYQSYSKNPAVLTVLATREGTSVTVIDNTRDAFPNGSVWGQRLFHNRNGERASLTGERESDFLNKTSSGNMDKNKDSPSVGDESGLNMVLLIQIPLKHKPQMRKYSTSSIDDMVVESAAAPMEESNVENAVIGSGPVEGPFTEIDGLKIQRDHDFPIRVTVQFYKATSNGIVSEKDIDQIAHQIRKVYSEGDYVSSLVTGGGTGRITEYDGIKEQPPHWWEDFWRRYEEETGDNPLMAMDKLEDLLGSDYRKQKTSELYLRDILRP